MTEVPDGARRAFRDADAFRAATTPGTYDVVTTPFEAEVTATGGDGEVAYEVTVRVPALSAATGDGVADVVEEGWYETFELRVADVGGVTRADRAPDPSVRREGDEVAVTMRFSDVDPRRGVEDALALVNFVEGTYVQGVIPGYEYVDPVAGLLAEARRAADG